jgi:DNA mismatch repair protein MutL
MESDPASIDINIHPTKTEIKFEDERSIWQILMAAVREALGRFNIVPSLDFDNEVLIDIPVRSSTEKIPEPPDIEINPRFNPFEGEELAYQRPDFIERFERENTANWEKLYSTLEKEDENPESAGKIREAERKFFQIKNKYIVCPVKSGLMLIDQKRAHERVLYERFMECLSKNRPVSQTELFPLTIELDPVDYSVLEEIRNDLKILGFTIDFAGENKILLKGRPSNSVSADLVEMVEIIIEEYKSTRTDPSAGAKEKLAAAMAGASAIPYGKALVQSEMENLFDSLFACSAPNYSPKGKPVINIITLDDLDKKFR